MKRFVALITVLALAAAVVAALAVPAANAGATKTVKVLDFKFTPKTLTVKKGTKVTWKWGGNVQHNVTVTQGPRKFASKTITKGSFAQTLTKPGTYHIVCTLHTSIGMVMTLKVTK
jgi:plastocyanin